MRRTITISVSEDMHSLIRTGMHSNCCSTVSEYIRFLVRRDRTPVVPENEFEMPQTANEAIEEALAQTQIVHGI